MVVIGGLVVSITGIGGLVVSITGIGGLVVSTTGIGGLVVSASTASEVNRSGMSGLEEEKEGGPSETL